MIEASNLTKIYPGDVRALDGGYGGLLAAFALACTTLATRASRAYQAQV